MRQSDLSHSGFVTDNFGVTFTDILISGLAVIMMYISIFLDSEQFFFLDICVISGSNKRNRK
jgi:hypothetical protein